MQAELSPVEREVAEVDSILGRYVKRIDAAKQSIPSIESDLPSPRNAAITRESYLRLRNDLIALRRELFALGLLNGRVVRVPSDPFTGQPQSDLRPFFQAKTQLPNAALALQEMSKAIAPEIESLNLIQTELGKLGSELAQLRGDPNDLAKRCDDLCARGRGDVAKWRSAWLGQLQNLPDAVVQLNAPTAQIEERCAEMDKQIASIRDRLKPKAGEAMDLTKAREEFAAMIATMNATAQDLRARGVAKAITMPTNPFEKRSSNDRVLVAEAEVQLKVGADTVRQIRSASAGLVEAAQQRAQAFIPRIQELQKSIATTTSDPKALLRVQSQYESLCAEILAANDQNSPS